MPKAPPVLPWVLDEDRTGLVQRLVKENDNAPGILLEDNQNGPDTFLGLT